MQTSILIDPLTGDIVFESDHPVQTTDPTSELYLAIGVPLGSIFSEPEQGSRIPGLVQGTPSVDLESDLRQFAQDAVARLEIEDLVVLDDIQVSGAQVEIFTTQSADPFIFSAE